MKNILIGFMVLCILCVVPVLAGDINQAKDIVSSKEVVAQFITSDKDKISYAGFEKTNYGSYNKFSTADGSEYYVNNKSNNIERVNTRFNGKDTQEIRLNQKNAENSAKKYLNTFSKNQNRTGLNIIISRLIDHGSFKEYSIEFREVVDGVILPDTALISINPSNGKLLSYISVNQKLTIPLKPQITKEDAFRIASVEYSKSPVKNLEGDLHVINITENEQRLVWVVKIICEPIERRVYGGYLLIDANNGEIFYNDPFL